MQVSNKFPYCLASLTGLETSVVVFACEVRSCLFDTVGLLLDAVHFRRTDLHEFEEFEPAAPNPFGRFFFNYNYNLLKIAFRGS